MDVTALREQASVLRSRINENAAWGGRPELQSRLDIINKRIEEASTMITVDTIGQYQTLYVHITDLRKGVRPGATRIVSIRRNGAVKTWKTRPTEFKAPFKYGLRDCLYVTQDNAHRFHATEEEAAQSPAGRWIDC